MNAVTDASCPKCQSSNPAGAKFCSSCRNPLQAAPAPSPVPPPQPINPAPPPRPNAGIGGMMSGGGKTVTKQVSGDAPAVYAQTARYLRGLANTDIQYEMAPQQLSAKVGYKSLGTTLGIGIEVDTNVQVASMGPGQSQVSISTKTDGSSTSKVLMTFVGIWALIWFSWGLAPMILILAAIAVGLTWWQMQSSPGESITKALVEDLVRNQGALASATPAPVSAAPSPPNPPQPSSPPSPPPPPPSPEPQLKSEPPADSAPASAPDEDEVFERIGKLARLREAGAITEAEFEAKKAQLLDRI